ncbi:sugar ABC transporter substrate-binding protein [Prauserella cavernicola]|uniref:Sugar ABC transporter substrate-binding protein n=1 Tax=Prauserella cavernicola TaxID=2800127 RepID=A0A934V9T4_9PSEU|nr:sugar ABC transporter substrate-binding protein [Prauserella cavernicola]MBK1789178.1 sugar ABC transporter substrate-binding protein [Prauserella cavernicola]
MNRGRTPTVALVGKNDVNPAFRGAVAAAERTARRLGVRLTPAVPRTPDDVDEQLALLRNLVAEPPSAVLLVPAHTRRLEPALAALAEAGVPTALAVGRTTPQRAVLTVGSDDRAMSRDLAQAFCTALGGRGRIGILDGNALSAKARPRANGFHDTLAEYPDVRVVSRGDGAFLRAPARSLTARSLDAVPDLDGNLAANDFMAMGVLDALSTREHALTVAGINATPAGVAAVRAGHLVATAAFDAPGMVAAALEGLVRHLGGEPVPSEVVPPTCTVTRANAARWSAGYENRVLPGWATILAHATAPAMSSATDNRTRRTGDRSS